MNTTAPRLHGLRATLSRYTRGVVLSLGLWFMSAGVLADEDMVVRIVRTDGAPIEPTLWADLQEAVAPLGVKLVEEASARPTLLVARIHPSSDGTELEITDNQTHTWLRKVPPLGSAELERETLAQVFLSMIEPTVRSAREHAVAAVVPEPVAATHRLRLRMDGYAGAVLEDRKHVAPRLLVSAALISDRRFRPGIALDLGWTLGPQLRRDGVAARLQLASLRVRPTLQLVHARRVALELGIPVGVDLAVLQLVHAPTSASTTDHSLRADPVVGLTLALRTRVSPRWELLALAGVDLDLAPHSWSVARGTATDTLVALQRARPYLALGASWGQP